MKTTIVIATLLGLFAGTAFAQSKEATPMKDAMPAAKDDANAGDE